MCRKAELINFESTDCSSTEIKINATESSYAAALHALPV